MYSNLFSPDSIAELTVAMQTQFPKAIWETFYVTLLSTALAVVIGLPLGVLLVAGEKGGVLPLPKALMSILNVIINLLRSIPFLILMIMVFPLSRLIIGTTVGTTATIVPLVVAAFPFVARLVESSLREVDPNIIEAAQSMGATPMQIICKVMIPESVPSLLQNFTIALTTILGYSAMSGIIGGGNCRGSRWHSPDPASWRRACPPPSCGPRPRPVCRTAARCSISGSQGRPAPCRADSRWACW